MGVITSHMSSNEPDPVTGLTPKEKSLVISSWNIVRKDITEYGIKLFMIFFRRRPEYQNYFPFREVPYEELPKNSKFKGHVVTVMYALTSIIDNLENSEVLVTLLQKTGESHIKKNIPLQAFQVLHGSILELLEKGLGSRINKKGLDAWDKALSVAFMVAQGQDPQKISKILKNLAARVDTPPYF